MCFFCICFCAILKDKEGSPFESPGGHCPHGTEKRAERGRETKDLKYRAGTAALWNDAFLCLFAGGFIYLDTVNISFVRELVVFNTYGKLLCGMLAVYFGQRCLCEVFTGKRRTLANAALLAGKP